MVNIFKQSKSIAIYFAGFLLLAMLLLINSGSVDALSCNDCVNSSDVVNRSLTGIDLKENSVYSKVLGNDSVNSSEIAANAVKSSELAPNSVNNSELVDDIIVNSLTAQEIVVEDSLFTTNIFNTEFLNLGSAIVTDIPDSGDGSPASFALNSSEAYAYLGLNCLDADGCDVTLAEDFLDGDIIFVYNAGTNLVNFADTSGVSELAGNFAMGEWDTLQLIFRDPDSDTDTSRWMEISRSDN